MKWTWVWVGLVVLGLGMMGGGCGLSPVAEAIPSPTVAGDSPEVVARQVIDALVAQDIVTLNRLVDDSMPAKDTQVQGELIRWNNRLALNPDFYYYDAIGSFLNVTLLPMERRGQTTMVRAHLYHAAGESELDLSLIETPQGWRVVAWSSRVVAHPTPTPKR